MNGKRKETSQKRLKISHTSETLRRVEWDIRCIERNLSSLLYPILPRKAKDALAEDRLYVITLEYQDYISCQKLIEKGVVHADNLYIKLID